MGRLEGHAENEHLCLALARALGLPAAKSEVREFDSFGALHPHTSGGFLSGPGRTPNQ
jgi:serine/threonine-protein kinase HipA